MTGEVLNVLKDIGSIAGTIISCATILTVVIRPIRDAVVGFIDGRSGRQEIEKRLAATDEKIDQLCSKIDEHIKDSRARDEAIVRDLETLKDADGKMIGNTIKTIYNMYKDKKSIPEKEFEMIEKLYDVYANKLHQNGVIEKIHHEIAGDGSEWEIILD